MIWGTNHSQHARERPHSWGRLSLAMVSLAWEIGGSARYRKCFRGKTLTPRRLWPFCRLRTNGPFQGGQPASHLPLQIPCGKNCGLLTLRLKRNRKYRFCQAGGAILVGVKSFRFNLRRAECWQDCYTPFVSVENSCTKKLSTIEVTKV